jgi:hypothetical protein
MLLEKHISILAPIKTAFAGEMSKRATASNVRMPGDDGRERSRDWRIVIINSRKNHQFSSSEVTTYLASSSHVRWLRGARGGGGRVESSRLNRQSIDA